MSSNNRTKRTDEQRSARRTTKPATRRRRSVFAVQALEERLLLASDATAGLITLPLSFEANAGQAASSVQFVARGQGYALGLSNGDAELQLRQAQSDDSAIVSDRISMQLVNSTGPVGVAGLDELPGKVNYFIGPDPTKWRSNISTYAKVAYQQVYPSIDLVYYGNQGQLEYDFIVQPGGDSSRIAMQYEGARSLRLDDAGNLLLGTSGGEVALHKPILYQTGGATKESVDGSFVIDGNQVRFNVGSYDHSRPLVIDPILVYSTYFGGTGDDQALAVAIDSKGAAYITGSTLSSDISTTTNALARDSYVSVAFKTTNSGTSWLGAGGGLPQVNFSALVVDPTNANVIYGGTSNDSSLTPKGLFKSIDGGASWTQINTGLPGGNSVTSLVMDPVNRSTLYVTFSNGGLFKTTNGGASWDSKSTGIDSKDSGAGIGALAISPSNPQILYVSASRNYLYKTTDGGGHWTRINGINPGTPSEIDQLPFTQRLIVDPSDPNIVYAGVTKGVFFDTPGGVYKSTNGGATFTRTAIGGAAQFSVFDMVMDPANSQTLYVMYLTFSTTTISKTTNGGSTWTQLSFPGGSANGTDLAIAPAPGGSALYVGTLSQSVYKSTDDGKTFTSAGLNVNGVTQVGVSAASPSTVYATTPGFPKDPSFNIATDAFVAKLNPAGTAYEYVTYLGGINGDKGNGIAVDASGNAYVAGSTVKGTFPTTPGAFQATSPSTSAPFNAFVTKLNPTGSALVYSTYLAGVAGGYTDLSDRANAIAVDSQGRAVVTGSQQATSFPSTPNAFDPTPSTNGGESSAFVTQFNADGSGLLYSTFLGGPGDQNTGYGVAYDGDGNIHVVGQNRNNGSNGRGPTNFPVTASAFQNPGGISFIPAGFYAKINPNLSGAASLLYSTVFYGTESTEPNTPDFTRARAVAVDAKGRAFVAGNTTAPNLPTRNGFQSTWGGDDSQGFSSDKLGDGFVAVFDPTKSGDASLVYSSFLGGASADAAYGVAIDNAGNGVVVGTTSSIDFPLKSGFTPFGLTTNAFLARINPDATGGASLVESSQFGGRPNGATQARGVAASASGDVVVAGFTQSPDFPVFGPAQGDLRGGTDAYVMKFSPTASTTNLGVTATATPDPVEQNENLTITFTVTNNSATPVDKVFLTDFLDVNDVFVSATPNATSVNGRIVNFALGPLAAGASTQVQLVVKVGAPLNPNVTLNNNTATVRADRPDTFGANNAFALGTQIKVKTAEIEMRPSIVGGSILFGQNFVYEAKVFNNGPDTATGVNVQVKLPGNVIHISSNPAATSTSQDGLTRTYSLPDIPAGSSASVLITLTPTGGVGAFSDFNASATVEQFQENTTNDSAKLEKVVSTPDQADLAVTVVGPASGITGVGDITYTATVVNFGPHPANNVVLTADATALYPITSITPSQGTATQANNIITAQLGTLAVGASATVTYVIRVDSDAQVTTNVSVDADESDPNLTDNKTKGRVKVRDGSLIFVVTNTKDSGPGSLRQALLDSEDAQSTVQFPNKIVFNIPEDDPGKNTATNAFVIRPLSDLPAIFNPAIIDGYTQSGASPNTNPIDQAINAKIRIELDGSREGLPNNGFDVYAFNTVIRGLAINRFLTKLQRGTTVNLLLNGFGVNLNTDRATVEGCFIGTDASGTAAFGNETTGIAVFGSSNTIGGTTPASRNLISGNGALGVAIATGQFRNVIIGNFIGTDITGAKSLPTNLLTVAGLSLASTGASPQGVNNTVGGTTPEARNIISGNNGAGVFFAIPSGGSSGSASNGNYVVGNYIGTDLTGTKAVPNVGDGVFNDAGVNNTIGGTTPGARNIISGNAIFGVEFQDAANGLFGNYIGTDVTGTKALPNGRAGVRADGAGGSIGAVAAGAGNIISGNIGAGVDVTYDSYSIAGNKIGLDANGAPLGNSGDGVFIHQISSSRPGAAVAQGNTVSSNTIAFNNGAGVAVTAFDASLGAGTGNAIVNNSIFSNKGLGIDLAKNGVTANHDALVTATGPNHLQNYPTLSTATFGSGKTTVAGALVGLANRDYTIQLFTNTFVDPSNSGEGETFIGQGTVRTDATGNATFSIPVDSVDTRGKWVTATASTGNPQLNAFGTDTSEFSQAVLVTGVPPATPVTVSTDLEVVINVGAVRQVGRDLVYSFTVTNHGPDTAHSVVLSTPVSFNVTVTAIDSTQGAAIKDGAFVTANLGTLAKDASATVTFTATPTVAGDISLSGAVTGFEPEANNTDNSTSAAVTIAPGALDTDIEITAQEVAGPYKLGDEILYNFTIKNNGPRPATNVNFADTLPAGATFVSLDSSSGITVSSGVARVNVGALAPGDSLQLFVAIKSTVAGDITNVANVTLFQTDSNPANNTVTLVSHILPAASVTILSGTPTPAEPGQPITFSANVVSPAGGQPQGTVVFREGTTNYGSKLVDAKGNVTLDQALSPGVHTITADYGGDPNFAPSSMSINVTVNGAPSDSADLNLGVQQSAQNITVGTTVDLIYTITNNGPAEATGITFALPIPSNAAYVFSTAGTVENGTLSHTVAQLAKDATAELTVRLVANSGTSLAATASLTSTSTDPNSTNDSATATVGLIPANSADVRMLAVVAPGQVEVGQELTYTFTVINGGASAATGVMFTSTIPAGATFVSTTAGSFADGKVTADLGTLAKDAMAIVAIKVTPTVTGQLSLIGSATATEPDPQSTNNTASASANVIPASVPNADVGVVLVATPNPVAQGQSVQLKATVTNAGPNDVSGVNLVVTLPEGLDFVSSSSGTFENGVLTVPIGDLANAANSVVTIDTTATGSGSLAARATITSTDPVDFNAANNVSNQSITSNAPITLNQSIDLVFGTIATPSYSGYPSANIVTTPASISTEVFNAILATPDLDPRLVAALTALRDSTPANPTNLNFFQSPVATDAFSAVFGTSVAKPLGAGGSYQTLAQAYKQQVTGSAGTLSIAPDEAQEPLAFSFPGLTTADSGQVRDGALTVRLFVRDATITGPISTQTVVQSSVNPSAANQEATFTATIGGNGVVHPPGTGDARVTELTFKDGDRVLGVAPVNSAGVATFKTSDLGPGQHVIYATFAGDDQFAPSVSNVVVQTVAGLSGPHVSRVQRFGIHGAPTSVTLSFDKALDSASASNRSNYTILAPGRDGRLGTADDQIVRIGKVTYDPTRGLVTLRTKQRLGAYINYRLIVNGSKPGAVTDTSGTALDGKHNGKSGSDYTTTVTLANLVRAQKGSATRHRARRHSR